MHVGRMPIEQVVGRAVVWGAALLVPLAAAADSPTTAGDDALRFERPEIALRGRDARCQLQLSQRQADGTAADRTREAAFVSDPPGIVAVDAQGLAVPLASGTAAVVARIEGIPAATATVHVEVGAGDEPINFSQQIVPLFTKFGCNGGGCHGKLAGQNGFRLSLLGSEPQEDYEHVVLEARGRRVFPAAPDASLLLQKAIAAAPHGGGQRLEKDSHEYRLLRRWISQAMPYGDPQDRRLTSIEAIPAARPMRRQGQQQLAVVARYSDGSQEDITRTAQYESNNLDMADVTGHGLVQVQDLAGEVSIMARYQGQVTVFRASVPLGTLSEPLPEARGPIDAAAFAKLSALGIPPAPLCDDATFLRRATLDVAGRLPTLAEVEDFRRQAVADAERGGDAPREADAARQRRRAALVDRLLASPDYAHAFAHKWSAILRNRHGGDATRFGAYAFHDWIRESIEADKPFDLFVQELLAASGDVDANPAVVWHRQVGSTESRIEDAAQLFLGQRLQCARCHHHPYEKWSQHDYFQMAAFFSTVERRPGPLEEEPRFVARVAAAGSAHPKTGETLRPAGLEAAPAELADFDDPRAALARWMTAAENPYFARSVANRYWKHFLGRGLVEPEDDMRVTNPPSNPELLDALAAEFVDSGFRLKRLVRAICTSTVYQLSSDADERNLRDATCYSRYYPKRLSAEVLLDAIDAVAGSTSPFDGMPAGCKAIELPDASFASYFLTVFGRPDGATACECERTVDSTLAQSLHLLNSKEMQGKLAAAGGRAATWAASISADAALSPVERVRQTAPAHVDELYLRALGRPPTDDERRIAVEHLLQRTDRLQEAYEDLVWSVVNGKEFLFNH